MDWDECWTMNVQLWGIQAQGPTETCSVGAAHERSGLGCVHELRCLDVGYWVLEVCSSIRFDKRPAICLDLSLTLEGTEVCTYVVVCLLVASIEGSSNQSEFEMVWKKSWGGTLRPAMRPTAKYMQSSFQLQVIRKPSSKITLLEYFEYWLKKFRWAPADPLQSLRPKWWAVLAFRLLLQKKKKVSPVTSALLETREGLGTDLPCLVVE